MPKRAAEFFAGIGLLRMGLDAEGWTTVWANDLDEKKWEMYRENFRKVPVSLCWIITEGTTRHSELAFGYGIS
jgi:site-specific DNA-cytosine methylase